MSMNEFIEISTQSPRHRFLPAQVRQEGQMGNRAVHNAPPSPKHTATVASIATESSQATEAISHLAGSHSSGAQGMRSFDVFIGAQEVREGKSRFLENRQVENFQGIAQGISQVLSGGFRSVSGIMFATTLVASLAKAGSVAIKTFAMVGEGAFAISSAFGALLSSIEIYQLVTAKKKIEKAGDKNAITMIQEEMEDPKLAATWKSVLGESLFERISNEKNVPTIGEIKAHITKKRNEALTLFVLNTVAAIVAVLSFVVTGGAAPLAFAVIEVALSVMWIAVEGQHIMHAQDMHKMSQREKALMYLSALFSLVVTITTSVLHVDLIPKVGTIIVGLGLLLVHIYAIYKMEKSEVHS